MENPSATARTKDVFVNIDRARFVSVGLDSGSDWKGGEKSTRWSRRAALVGGQRRG